MAVDLIAPSGLEPTINKVEENNSSNKTTITKINHTPKTDSTSVGKSFPARTLDTWFYDIDFFYIRPNNEKVNISNFIKDFSYTMDFDKFILPIYSMIILGNDFFIEDIKYHLDNLKFFLTVKKFKRDSQVTDSDNTDTYIKKLIVFKDREMLPINPSILDLTPQEASSDARAIPRRRVRIDFINKKDNELNHNVNTKIYKDVTMFDVISNILTEAEQNEKAANKDSNEVFKITISPPDNKKRYEQVILTPGPLTEVLNKLQQDYGIYSTGVRVYLSSSNINDNKVEKIITVTDKGGVAPLDNSITKALFEVAEYTNTDISTPIIGGSTIENNTIICRTYNPYVIERLNSKKLLLGESIRTVGSSQERHSFSLCDVKDGFVKQKTYWNKSDNPFLLTEIQDIVKQNDAVIVLKMDNIDVLMLSNNMEYNIKFYNKDDTAYSGVYRITNIRFQFSFINLSDKTNISISSLVRFTNIPKLSVEGEPQEKQSYSDKLENYNSTDNEIKKIGLDEGNNIKNVPTQNIVQNPNVGLKGPFKVAFPGQEDNNGLVIPKEIDYFYKMSEHIVFGNIYDTAVGPDVKKAHALCNNYRLFMAAQILSKRILDPLVTRFGKFQFYKGKLNSCYRIGTGSSQHLLALAADMVFTGKGDTLADAYYYVVQNRDILGFDQVILESNGGGWAWLHVGIRINGTNRKQCMYTKTASKGNYKYINPAKFTSPTKAYFNNIESLL